MDIGDVPLGEWVDAKEVAHEAGTAPGAWVRILVWPGGTEDPRPENTLFITEHQVPSKPYLQRHELEAWLGDDHGLTDDQVTDLADLAEQIQDRYPHPDDEDERQAAMIVAYQLLLNQPGVVDELAQKLARARHDQITAMAGLRQAALLLIPGSETEAGFARRAGLDRMTVRVWLGKR